MFAFDPCQGRAPREDGVDHSFIVSCRQSGGIGHADIVRRLIQEYRSVPCRFFCHVCRNPFELALAVHLHELAASTSMSVRTCECHATAPCRLFCRVRRNPYELAAAMHLNWQCRHIGPSTPVCARCRSTVSFILSRMPQSDRINDHIVHCVLRSVLACLKY